MEAESFKTMLMSADALESRNLLNMMRSADFPSINSSERSKLHKEIHKKAFPNAGKKVVLLSDIERIFNG